MTESRGRYRRARELTVEIDSAGSVFVNTAAGTVNCGPHGLAILDAFAEPVSIDDAMAGLTERATGQGDWIALTGMVRALVRRGILIGEGDGRQAVTRGGRTYPTDIHVSMLEDDARTSAFLAAVRGSVRPGDVVVEVGSGSGILAVSAALAGAGRVYAIEASVGDWTRAVAEANGVGDKVIVIEGWSTRVEIPEPADLFVSEMVGNDLFEEGMLEVVLDARARMLRPGARIIPRAVELHAAPVELPEGNRLNRAIDADRAAAWSERYGVDLSPMVDLTAENRAITLLGARDAANLRALAPGAVVAQADLATVAEPSVTSTATIEVETAGRVDGAVSWFALDLAPDVRLERPWDAADRNHWSWLYPLWTRPPLAVEAGDRLELTYRHRIADVGRAERLTVEPV